MKYVALKPVAFVSGSMLRLTEAQLSRLVGLVKPAGDDGWFEVVSVMPVQFKVGEAFECVGELPKAMADEVAVEGSAGAVRPAAKSVTTKARR